jgi:hypothetical protein
VPGSACLAARRPNARRRCVSPTSATALHDTSTCSNGPTLGVTADALTPSITSVGAKAPPNGPSGRAVDVALPASTRSTTLPASSDEGAGAGCSWWVSRSRSPLRRRPVAAVFSTAREEEERISDAPCRDAAQPKPRAAARTASPAPSSKGAASPARSAFPRRVARSAPAFADASNTDPPPCRGFCHPRSASDALSPFATMRKG